MAALIETKSKRDSTETSSPAPESPSEELPSVDGDCSDEHFKFKEEIDDSVEQEASISITSPSKIPGDSLAEENDETRVRSIGFHEMDSALDDEDGAAAASDSSLSDDETAPGSQTPEYIVDGSAADSATPSRRRASVRASETLRRNVIEAGEDDDYRVYDDEDDDPDFQTGNVSSKKRLDFGEAPQKSRKKSCEDTALFEDSFGADFGEEEPTSIKQEQKPKLSSFDLSSIRDRASPEAVTLDEEADDENIASSTDSQRTASKPKKVQMQLRFKCLEKTCSKKFITKIALNTHCKKNHSQLLKQRAIREEQAKLEARRQNSRASSMKKALEAASSLGNPLARRAASLANFNGASTSNLLAMTRPSSSFSYAFPSTNAVPFPNIRPAHAQSTSGSYSSQAPSVTPAPSYSSLKSTLLRGNPAYLSSSPFSTSGYGAMTSNGFGAPPRSTFGLGTSPSALVQSPTKAVSTLSSSPFQRAPFHQNSSVRPGFSQMSSVPRSPGWSTGVGYNGKQQQFSRAPGGPLISRPGGISRGATMGASPSSPLQSNLRFKRVHASHLLNAPSPDGALRSSPTSNSQSPKKLLKDTNVSPQHKCRFSSCRGKHFLTDRALISHYAKHHDKQRRRRVNPEIQQPSTKLKCAKCDLSFLTQEGLDKHIKRVHKRKEVVDEFDDRDVKTENVEDNFAVINRSDTASRSIKKETAPVKREEEEKIYFDDDDDDDAFNLDDMKFDFLNEDSNGEGDESVTTSQSDASYMPEDFAESSKRGKRAENCYPSMPVRENDQWRTAAEGGRREGRIEKEENVETEIKEAEEEDEELEREIEVDEEVYESTLYEQRTEKFDLEGDSEAAYNSFAEEYVLAVGLKPCYVPMEKLNILPEFVFNYSRIIKPKKLMKGQNKFRASQK